MADALTRKVAWRLLPFLGLAYLVAYLDRVNVGFAALTMNRDIGLSDAAFGFGAGLFFLGYFLFEVPSNLILERVGARIWIGRIMITWALVSGATAFVTGEWSFYVVRVLLGLAEAGFFPGIILYLTYWFPAEQRAGIVGLFMVAIPISSVLGSPLSGIIMTLGDGVHGLAGWQWLYLVEAVPSLIMGLVAFFWLTDRPESAAWLNPQERIELAERIARDRQDGAAPKLGLGRALAHPRILGLSLVYFGLSSGLYGIGLWLPQIVGGFGLSTVQTGFVAAIPYAVAACGMVAWTRRSDAKAERTWHVALPTLGGGLALAAAAQAGSPVLAMIALCAATLGVFCALPTFWSLPTALLTGSAAAGGIALINAVGNLGGFFGPAIVGRIKGATGRFDLALLAIAGVMIVAGLLTPLLARGLGRHAVTPLGQRPGSP